MVTSELDALLGDRKLLMLVILCAVGLVLLIACGNIANMLLARLSERTREIAVRAALGASRGRIVRQLLLESLTLSFAGGLAGCLLAFLATPLVLRLIGTSVPRAADASVSLSVLGFALAVTVLAGVLFGVIPAIQATKTDLVTTLKAGGRTDTGGNSRLRSAVIVGEVALGIVLTAGAGLLTSSFVKLMRSDLGFRPDHVLTFRFDLPDDPYADVHGQFYRDYFERLRALPGVESAAGTMMLPMTDMVANVGFSDPEHPVPTGQRPSAEMSVITPGYFHTMQTPILKGRDFNDADTMASQQVLIVNRAFADRFFPGEEILGKSVKPGAGDGRKGGPPLRQVVGVVSTVRSSITQRNEAPAYYIPVAQLSSWCCLASTVRTTGDPHSLEVAARQLVQSIDKELPVTDVTTMPELLSLQLAQPRFAMVLLGAFAVLALLLTMVGLYGVMMYSVTRRTQEIGVRLALGAERGRVLRMVLGQAGKLVGGGVVLGLIVAIASASVLKTMLYGTTERDPLVLTAVCAAVALTGLLAASIPAIRAAAIEPMVALRHE
jgi:predicted permease